MMPSTARGINAGADSFDTACIARLIEALSRRATDARHGQGTEAAMGRHFPLSWVFVASLGCVVCSGAIAQAGPVNSVARYMGVGWSEGRHARNNCPQSLHPS